ncbi:uncharacterized protein LOC125661448 [Ostrea edulis]|uniref:uncharacterized protein LOC125682409 n=1 Tax=Ostrea edulis TaxID=37623 RepID=UPI0024AEC490|nr:uncharacterized protein LOC125682409 [Ostrea edulis]XP_055998967.1 uncharacterized protein LOC125661448 [Ostrea edulis]
MESEVSESESDTGSSSPPQPVAPRGRGRPRKLRGGRGRPRMQREPDVALGAHPRAPTKRGRRRVQPPVEMAATALAERRDIESKVDALSPDEMRDTLKRVVRENPEYLFSILEPEQRFQPSGGGTVQPSWCICSHCRDMPTPREKVCCQRNPDNCISRLPDFGVLILDEAVLALARLYRQDILAMPEDADRNRANRHTGYRQFVLWHHGKLGAGDRRVIPSCCVWRIRDKFPDPHGHYIGFKDNRLQ